MKTAHSLVATAAATAAVATLALPASTALAQPGPAVERLTALEATLRRDRPRTGAARHLRLAAETAGMLAIGTAWYWRRDDQGRWGGANVVDWQLGFRGSSLTSKLGMTREGWRFDGNSFGLNAVGHPMFGALTYFEARRLGYGVGSSFLASTAASGAWELFTEWAEYGSINDIVSTSTTGVPIGEAGYQLLRNWKQARYQVGAGAGAANGERFAAFTAGAALDTLPRTGAGWTIGGRRVSLGAEIETDDRGVRGVEAAARTTLVGYHRRARGYRLFAGAAAAFGYRDRKDRAAREWDLLATVGAGPQVDVETDLGPLRIHAGAESQLAFAMARSQAFDGWRAANPAAIVRNSMQDKLRPYYYGRDVVVSPWLVVRHAGVEVGGTITMHAIDSLDGADRDQEMLTADPHIGDQDVGARAWIGYTRGPVQITLDRRSARRTGAMDGVTGRAQAESTLVTLSLVR